MYFDPTYFLYVALPTLILSAGVQFYLKATFAKWSQTRNSSGLNGMQVGQVLFNRTSLNAIPLERIPGSLTDHFDPGANIVRLSDSVGGQNSIAAMAVSAHELGHVQQYQTGSGLIIMRSFLLPAVRFSPTVSYVAILMGLTLNITGLIWAGVFIFALMVMFSLLTLPVEIDASRRGLLLLKEAGLLENASDATGARQVLIAAALTYLAAAITSVLQLLYYVSLARRNR
ncbi:zinc metallopeptidase [Anaerolineales bacterium HSG24]|nr:zinc metallopeptidase [Anaerolineales bacterium HSG24]